MKEQLNSGIRRCLLWVLVSAIGGCQIPDSFIETNGRIEEDGDLAAWTARQDQWIYTQMKHHYLWNEELKDSLMYDYTLEPSKFFESMKVPQDRFSYCTANKEYVDTKAAFLNESVPLDSVYVREGKVIGYFQYSHFGEETDLTDIILLLKEKKVEELIVDLRGNPGGLVETCLQFASYLVPIDALGKVFCWLKYNKTVSAEREKMYGSIYTFYYLKDDVVTRNRNLGLRRVFFIADDKSASSSELLINCLRPYLPVTLIGTSTVGKDVGMYSIQGRQYKYILEPITFRSYNAVDQPVPETGLAPDIEISQKPYSEDGKIIDPALEAAFTCIEKEENKQ